MTLSQILSTVVSYAPLLLEVAAEDVSASTPAQKVQAVNDTLQAAFSAWVAASKGGQAGTAQKYAPILSKMVTDMANDALAVVSPKTT